MIVEALLTAAVMGLIIAAIFVPWYVILSILLACGAGFVYGGGTFEIPS